MKGDTIEGDDANEDAIETAVTSDGGRGRNALNGEENRCEAAGVGGVPAVPTAASRSAKRGPRAVPSIPPFLNRPCIAGFNFSFAASNPHKPKFVWGRTKIYRDFGVFENKVNKNVVSMQTVSCRMLVFILHHHTQSLRDSQPGRRIRP